MRRKNRHIKLGNEKIALPKALDLIAQSIYVVAIEMQSIDPNDYYRVWLDLASQLIGAAEVMRGIYEQLDTDWDGYYIRLPKDIYMQKRPNPLYDPDTAKPFKEGKGDAAGTWGDKSSIDDLPF